MPTKNVLDYLKGTDNNIKNVRSGSPDPLGER
jgi:hypothetical protein